MPLTREELARVAEAQEWVLLTREEVMMARTPQGGWTRGQVAILGVAWPLKSGWIEALVGKRFTGAKVAAFLRAGARYETKSLFGGAGTDRLPD